MIRFTALPLLVAATLSTGCATVIPVVGQLEDGTPMLGENDVLAGTFWAASTSGLRCSGTYDNRTLTSTIIVSLHCNDGRTGKAIATRSGVNASGGATPAIAELNDGTKAQFVIGPNVSYQQVFGNGATAIVQTRR